MRRAFRLSWERHKLKTLLICQHCGAEMIAGRRDARFCSKKCCLAGQPPCSVEGCDRPLRAKGLCNSHHKASLGSLAYKKVVTECAFCGLEVTKGRTSKYAKRYCSMVCRDKERHWNARPRRCAIPWDHPVFTTRLGCLIPDEHPARFGPLRGQSCRVFIPDCVICGRAFATPYTSSTCSEDCATAKHRADRNERKLRRRARKHDAFVAPVYRLRVFERDRWRCHLCGKKVHRTKVVPHPLAPTIDHVIPLGGGNNGTHEPANARTAHFICNARKGDRGGNEQLMLIG